LIKSRHILAIIGAFLLGAASYALTVSNIPITPKLAAGFLQISAPRLHFIDGKLLERLHNGAAVPFDFQLSVSSAATRNIALERALERFVISYDVWEERFRVVRVRNSLKSSSHLTASAAEAWCLSNISLPAAGIPGDIGLWVKLEVRSSEPKTVSSATDGGISLTTLIDVFSHPTRNAQEHWQFETGPFRINDLKR
jgi:hypothetical protein